MRPTLRSRFRRLRLVAPAAALVILIPRAAIAQAPAGVLEGVVTDATGGAVVSASVLVREAETNQSRTIVTDGAGAFRLAYLPVGTYDIRVHSDGFSDYARDGIALTIGQTVHLSIRLVPAGVIETVGVTAQAPALDTRQTAMTTTVDSERIEELPVQSRNYLNFVLLAPGVVPSQPGTPSGSASALPDSGFSFAGLRPRSNTLTIDGLDNNDHYTGGSRTELSLEIVREFQVINNGWSAENGGASGGSVNVVTKSGVNTIHGDAFLFGESGRLDARPPLEDTLATKPPLTRYRAGFAFGGPLRKDRTFYYGAVERERMDGQAGSDIAASALAAINGVLASGRFPQLVTQRLATGAFPIAAAETEWSAKANHQVGTRHSLMARVAGTRRNESADAFNTGGLIDANARGSNRTRDTALTAAWTAIVGETMTNELRGQLSIRQVDLRTTDARGPGVVIAGIAEFGRPYSGNDSHHQRYTEAGDTLAWSRGAHFIKAGFDFTNLALTGTRTDGAGGIYLFRSIDAFTSGQPDQVRQTFGQSGVDWSTNRGGVFVQEHWTPKPQFTLDAGARFDAESVPSSLAVANRQWTPRLGVAWLPAPKWLIRGGAGIFADRIVLAALEPALLVDGRLACEQILDGAAATAVFASNGGGAAPAALAGVAPSIYTVRAGSWHPSSRQVTIGVEREITPNLSASVNYLFVRGHGLTRTVNVNLPPPIVLTPGNASSLAVDAPVQQQIGRAVFGPARLDPTFDDVFQLQPTASSSYQGVTAALNRRLADEIEWSVAYTWSHATDTASDFDEQPQNPYNLNAEAGDSRYDERHRLVASALVELPIGDERDQTTGGPWVKAFRNIEVAPILTIDSGRPVNALTGLDDARTHAYPATARPLGAARNSLRLPASATLDLRILKFFPVKPHGRLDLVAEAFNLFNRINVTSLNAVYGQSITPLSTFGRAIDAAAARRFQFSVDFEF